MPKKYFPLLGLGILVILVVFGLVIWLSKREPASPEITGSQRQLINVLPISERPFVALFPHPTNKLITLYVINRDAKNLALEIEYLSGNALKGGRASVPAEATFPYTKAFLLGSCSAGGKCSFDTDITTGTIKTKLDLNNESHVLRSNYTFVATEERSATSDQKIAFTPETKIAGDLIVGGSHGFIGELAGEAAFEPVVLTSSSADEIVGILSLAGTGSKVLIYDGDSYIPLESTSEESATQIKLDHRPQEIETTIIRDDLKGAEEAVKLYMLGPIVILK